MEEVLFRTFNKSLSLMVEVPYREPFAGGLWKDHMGRFLNFQNGWLRTSDEKDIQLLKAHKLFSETPDVKGKFWVYVAPPNLNKIIEEQQAELEKTKKELEELKAAKAAKVEAMAKARAAKAPKEENQPASL